MKSVYRATPMFWKCSGTNAPKRVTPNTENTCQRDQNPPKLTQQPWSLARHANECKQILPRIRTQVLCFSGHLSHPTALQDIFRERDRLGLGNTYKHEEEDEGHDVGQVRHRLQDDIDDSGQGLHCHAHMDQPKDPVGGASQGCLLTIPRPLPPRCLPPTNGTISLLLPGSQTDAPLTFRAPNPPERVGDGDDVKLFYEEPHKQYKDNCEVEDIPAILNGGAAHKGLSSPTHVSIPLALPHPKHGRVNTSKNKAR